MKPNDLKFIAGGKEDYGYVLWNLNLPEVSNTAFMVMSYLWNLNLPEVGNTCIYGNFSSIKRKFQD